MNKLFLILPTLVYLHFGCVRKKRLDDLAFKFCDKVTESKTDYLRCFTDVSECYEKSSDKFDPNLKFIECARLFKVKEPNYQPFKYVPTYEDLNDDLDAEIWKEIENLDAADEKRKKKPEPKVEKIENTEKEKVDPIKEDQPVPK